MDATLQSSPLPLLAVLVSLLAVPAILLASRRPNLREGVSLAAAGAKFAIVVALLGSVMAGERPFFELLEIAPGISLSLRVDPLGIFFALVSSGLWILTTVYSIGYMRGNGEKRQTRYYASFALSLSATVGIAFASNLLTFLVFYELLTLATYPLVVHKESPAAIRAGRMYLAYALSAGLLFLAATVWIQSSLGTAAFVPGGFIPEGVFNGWEMKTLFVLFMAGVGVKAAIMPLHSWLPAAMVAPTPVSALLHAVAVVKSGAFGVLRIAGFVFGPETMREHGLDLLLAGFAGTTIVAASLIALKQDDLKKRLAYSTVGHLSYIVMGAALASTAAFTGSLLHLSAHALMKITLFLCAGAIYVHTHKTRVSELDGLGRAMPWTFGAFAIGSLGLAGIPPVNGFISKWWLASGSLDSGHAIVFGIFLLSGLLNAGYFFPIVIRGFFHAPPGPRAGDSGHPGTEASPWMVVPLCLTAALAVVFGILPDFPLPFFELARQIAESVTLTGAGPAVPQG
ncbi:MAG: monovalent cation/H+ antiporter subunit D family protein [Oceanipulchritudo sp.]